MNAEELNQLEPGTKLSLENDSQELVYEVVSFDPVTGNATLKCRQIDKGKPFPIDKLNLLNMSVAGKG